MATWDVVAALGSAVGAIAAAVGAGAAWRAAVASERTGADAREALAVAIQPHMFLEVVQIARDATDPMPSPTRLAVRVVNLSRWPATDLEVEATYASGERVRDRRERLDAFADEDEWWVPLRDVVSEWPPHDEPEPLDVAIRYADERNIGRYERTLRCNLKGGGVNLAVNTSPEPEQERRLR